MGMIENLPHGLPGVTDDSDLCSWCNRHASAFWMGRQLIKVCPSCALDILPAFIADALFQQIHTEPMKRFEFSKDIAGGFFRALLSAEYANVKRPKMKRTESDDA